MKLKLDENGNAVLQDGKPVYVHDDGREVAYDIPQTVATITRLNGEAKSHRERAEAAEATLKTFEGIKDPKEALKALETMQNLDHKKLVDAGEVERVKTEIIKAADEKYAPFVEKAEKLERELFAEKVGGSFARSEYVSKNLQIPSDLVQAKFGGAFKVEDGVVVAYDNHGNKILSPSRIGEVANFDEALEVLVSQYPHKDSILKGSSAQGGGAQGAGGAQGGAKQVSRAVFDAMPPDQQRAHALGGGSITD